MAILLRLTNRAQRYPWSWDATGCMQMRCITNQPLIQNLAGLILTNIDLESSFLKSLTDCRHGKLFIRPLYWIWSYYLYLILTRPRKWMVNNCNLHTFFNQIFFGKLGSTLLRPWTFDYSIIKLLKACQLTAAFKNDAKLHMIQWMHEWWWFSWIWNCMIYIPVIQCWWGTDNFTHMVHDCDFVRRRGWSNGIAWYHWK